MNKMYIIEEYKIKFINLFFNFVVSLTYWDLI
jgi:hypothetical protein